MYISPTYVGRADLSRFDKCRFTMEELIEKNARVRSFYRRYYMLPQWVHSILTVVWFLLSAAPIILALCCERVIQIIVADDCAGRGGGGIALFLVSLVAIAYFHPIGWVLIVLTLQFVAWLWFVGVMRYYGEQLQREIQF